FSVSVRYYYDGGSGEATGSADGSISIESLPSSADRVFPVVLSECDLSEKELSPSKEYSGKVTIKNIGTADMRNVFVDFSAGDSFLITGGTASAYVPLVAKGGSVTVPVKIKTLSEISSLRQELGMTLKYSYSSGSEGADGSYDTSFTMFAPISAGSSPTPIISLNKLDEPLKGGQKYQYYVVVENKGGTDMTDVKLSLRGSDGIIIVESTDSAFIENIPAGGKKSAKVVFRTAAELTSPIQSITADLSYNYSRAGQVSQGQESAALSLDAKVSGAPTLKLYGDSTTGAIVGGREYSYAMTVKNFGEVAVKDIYLDFTASDSIYFLDGTEYSHIDSIGAGESRSVTVKFKTTDNISSVKQTIAAQLNYSYGSGTALARGNSEASVTLIAAGASEGGTSAAPNIIIGSYDIGAEQIPAGEVFNLTLDFVNTSSSVPVENIIMTVNAGGDINIYGGGNTFYYPNLSAAGQVHEEVALRALPNAATGTSSVTVEFKYDYLDGAQRNTLTAQQQIFIPVYQPDKITFDVNVPTYSVYAGNETYITTSYMNKGHCDISNVKAELVGDVSALSTSKVIGNVAPGANGTFDFIVTPYMGGECSFTILVTYEDANFKEVQKEIPVSFMVEEMMWDDGGGDWGEDFPIDEPVEEKGFPWLIVIIAAAVVVVAVIVVICVVRAKKKKAKKLSAEDIDWGDDDEELFSKNDTTKV
ncbi:MAG: COG1361 S-layer family protein, partial [Oscillospiraceae bacterium]